MSALRPVLIVDDSADDVELIRAALADFKLANPLHVARDGEEALRYLRREGPHAARPAVDPAVVLLDLKMPKVDGLEVLREVRADARIRHIPIVMVTSSREEQDLVRSYALGVNAYVVKPVDFHAFADAVRSLGAFWAVLNEPPPSGAGAAP